MLARFEAVRRGSKIRLVIRVLKYLKPPNPEDTVVQKEGELLTKYDPVDKVTKPWVSKSIPKFITPSSLKLLEHAYISKDSS